MTPESTRGGSRAARSRAIDAATDTADRRWMQSLGYAGLLPFVAGVAAIAIGAFTTFAANALSAYGAVILTFVGAVHWGWALREDADEAKPVAFVTSVLPSLVAWLSLLPPSPVAGLGLQMAAFAAWHLFERRAGFLPPAYLSLRLRLTAAVVALEGVALLMLLHR